MDNCTRPRAYDPPPVLRPSSFLPSPLNTIVSHLLTVQRALGHSWATATLNTYSHLWPTAEDRTRAAAADLMAQAFRQADAGP